MSRDRESLIVDVVDNFGWVLMLGRTPLSSPWCSQSSPTTFFSWIVALTPIYPQTTIKKRKGGAKPSWSTVVLATMGWSWIMLGVLFWLVISSTVMVSTMIWSWFILCAHHLVPDDLSLMAIRTIVMVATTGWSWFILRLSLLLLRLWNAPWVDHGWFCWLFL